MTTHHALWLAALTACWGYMSLSYPDSTRDPAPTPIPTPPPASESGPASVPEPIAADESGAGLGWHDLTRLAREHVQRGELAQAEERLIQAEMQLAGRPAALAPRRTIFGMQARLAVELARQGEIERADALAHRLFDVAETEPAIGGDALVTLARSVVARRAQSPEPMPVTEKLRILDLALTTAEAGRLQRGRLDLAFEVSQAARHADSLPLARRAIDLAERDARLLHPDDRRLIASIVLERARVALEQQDLEPAERAATTARALFDEVDASEGERGLSEITLAGALAGQGESERARSLADAAAARLDADPPPSDYVRRAILTGLARLEQDSGNTGLARRLLEEALSIPPVDSDADRHLVSRIERDLEALSDAVAGTGARVDGQPTDAGTH